MASDMPWDNPPPCPVCGGRMKTNGDGIRFWLECDSPCPYQVGVVDDHMDEALKLHMRIAGAAARLATAEQERDRLKRMFVESTDATKRVVIYEENDRLREALKHATGVLDDVVRDGCCVSGHAGDEETGEHYEDCLRCKLDAAIAHAEDALSATAPKRDATGQMGGDNAE